MAKHKTQTHEGSRRVKPSNTDLEEQIRLRAYELYEQRGGEHGYDLDDWLQAESELTQPKPEAVAA
jgi:Protein of unknown function (DUF2934)